MYDTEVRKYKFWRGCRTIAELKGHAVKMFLRGTCLFSPRSLGKGIWSWTKSRQRTARKVGLWKNTSDSKSGAMALRIGRVCPWTGLSRYGSDNLSTRPDVLQWTGLRPLQWRHNERDGVSNQRRLDCLHNCLFGRRSKKTSKLRVTGLCEGNPSVTGDSPHKGTVTRKVFPFDYVVMQRSI